MSYKEMERYYNDFIQTLQKRKESTLIDYRVSKKIQKVAGLSFLICTFLVTFFMLILSCLYSDNIISWKGIVIYALIAFVCWSILTLLTYVLVEHTNNLAKRIKDLDYKIENVEFTLQSNKKFNSIKFASENNWFLDSMDDITKFKE